MPDTGDFGGDEFGDLGSFGGDELGESGGDSGDDTNELLRLLAPLLDTPGTGPSASPFGLPFAIPPNATPEQAIQALLSLVAPQLRGRLSGILTAIPALQAQANASPMALLGAGGPQLAQLLQQYRQGLQGLSRSLGPFGGGFLTQGRQRLGGQFASALAQLFGGLPGQAQGLLGKIAEGTSIAFPVPQTRVGTGVTNQPGGFSIPTAGNIGGIQELIQGISRLFGSSPAPTGTFGTGDIGGMF